MTLYAAPSLILMALAASPLAAQQPLLDLPIASDDQLDAARGKFLLPNGVEIAMTVQTDTSVDGQLLLRSVFSVDQGPPRVTVYSPASTQQTQPTSTAVPQAQAAQPSDIWVSFDRESGVSLVERSYKSTVSGVSVSAGNAPIGASPDGSAPLALQPDQATSVPRGTVSLAQTQGGYRVTLASPDLEINHLFGQSLGSVLLNTANDRTIDTTTNINLDLANATPAMIGSALPRTESLALDVSRDLIR